MDDKQRVRFWAKVDQTGACWLWTGTLHNGYGVGGAGAGRAGPNRWAHRRAYEDLVGPIPTGLMLDHVCHTRDTACPGGVTCPHRRCVNPAHLEPVTMAENLRRGRNHVAEWARRTVCPAGHPLPPPRNGHRRCQQCKTRRNREARALARASAKGIAS